MTAARQLDVIIANMLGEDDEAMADWVRGRRVSYKRRATSAEPATRKTKQIRQV